MRSPVLKVLRKRTTGDDTAVVVRPMPAAHARQLSSCLKSGSAILPTLSAVSLCSWDITLARRDHFIDRADIQGLRPLDMALRRGNLDAARALVHLGAMPSSGASVRTAAALLSLFAAALTTLLSSRRHACLNNIMRRGAWPVVNVASVAGEVLGSGRPRTPRELIELAIRVRIQPLPPN